MQEIRKDVIGYEWYYTVSNLWRVRWHKWKIMKGKIEKVWWYFRLDLRVKNIRKTVFIHKLVSEAFLWKQLWVVDHINNNKIDNCVSNLQILSHKANITKYHQDKLMLKVLLKNLYKCKHLSIQEFIKVWISMIFG